MNADERKIEQVGEIKLIEEIEKIISEKMGDSLNRDDCFYFSMEELISPDKKKKQTLVFNTDMLVSTTDAPPQMSFYQMGHKAVIMNLSDLIVKGVLPKAVMISLGLNREMLLKDFKHLVEGIVDSCKEWNIDYIGGDVNETKELIISPTIFGVQEASKIIPRGGIQVGDIVAINSKFGLTGTGFDILLSKKNNQNTLLKYKKSIQAVLEPRILGREALILAEKNLATASIDSSDGLAKSLQDLMLSNSGLGFEIRFDENLIHEEALQYSQETQVPLEELVFNAGEEFIHLFIIHPSNLEKAREEVKRQGGALLEIGKIIFTEKIYILKESERLELKSHGFVHLIEKD